MNDLTWIVYPIVLALIGLVHLISKAIEKANKGEKGKNIDLAKTVQEQINRYRDRVRERTGVGGLLGHLTPTEEARPKPPPPPAAPPPMQPARDVLPYAPPARDVLPYAPPARDVLPPAAPARDVLPYAPPAPSKPVVRKSFWKDDEIRRLKEKAGRAAILATSAGPIRLNRNNLKRAVLLAEMLGPPVGDRKEHRLF